MTWKDPTQIVPALIVALCVVVLSGCATRQDPALQQQAMLDQMEIGTTTTEEVSQQFGKPTVTSVKLMDGAARQAWGYGYAQTPTNPLRYLPFVGALGVVDVQDVAEPLSFSVSFSEQEVLLGFTQRKLGRYTVAPDRPGSPKEVMPYGARNLNARAGYISPTSY